MIGRCIGFIASLAFICGIASGAAQARPKLALVIGNSNYTEVAALPNPAKDADAMANFLAKAGFDVTRANNLTQAEMRGAFRDFADKIAAAGPDADVVVEYDGHGVQTDGENYLVPVDAHIAREADVPIAAVRLNDVMNILSSVPAHSRIVILNACRNNPFSTINKIGGPGLAIADARQNSIIAYATAPGATALDGDGDHSPFTTALLNVAATPGLPVEQVFKKVRLAVNKATGGEQTPWDSSSLTNDFFFIPGDRDTSGKPQETLEQDATQHDASKQRAARQESPEQTVAMWRDKLAKVSAQEAYDMVILADVVEGYEAFVTIYPKFEYVVRIRKIVDERLEQIEWYKAFTINSVISYQTFLVHYPDSAFAQTAKRLLERAKNRSFGTDAFASANANDIANTGAAAASPKVITKVVEKPVVVTKVIEKPVVVEKIVRQVVRVPGPCECRDCGRRTERKGRIIVDKDEPVRRQHVQPRMQFQAGRSFNSRRF